MSDGKTLDPKQLYRVIESIFAELKGGGGPQRVAVRLVPRLLDHLGTALALRGGHLYRRDGDAVRMAQRWGDDETPDLSTELRRRLADVEGPAEAITELPWTGPTRGGLTGLMSVGEKGALLIALFVHRGVSGDPARRAMLATALASIDYAARQHLRRNQLEDVMLQARAIQMSLLPAERPTFADFDIAAASVPAESVGGDLYDYFPLDAETLTLAIADASGHGLPAALQARDVITGLRMGSERDLKITRTVEKLGRIIHRSGLVTRFVSMVFGELEANGNFAYINAGHPPPLLLDDTGIRELTVGGMILGPDPDAVYKLGFAHLDRGSAMVLYTDGVIERGATRGKEFGIDGLRSWLTEWRQGPSDRAVEDLLERLAREESGPPFEDDVTVLYVRRPG